MKKLQLPALSNAKKLKRSELKNVFGGSSYDEEFGSGCSKKTCSKITGKGCCALYLCVMRTGECIPT